MLRSTLVVVGLLLSQVGCQSTIPPEVEKQMQMNDTKSATDRNYFTDPPTHITPERVNGGIQ
jgi:hypothetical protein